MFLIVPNGGRDLGIRDEFRSLLNNKTVIFILLNVLSISIVTFSLLIPHLSQPNQLYHIVLHIISLEIAAFITAISIISFRKTRNNKIIFTSISFMLLMVIESIYLAQAGDVIKIFYLPLTEVEFSHLLLLCMLTLFAWGVLQSNTQK